MKETLLQQNIAQLRTRLLVMCASVGMAVDEACDALAADNKEKARAVMDGDDAVNALENEIDELALSILVRNQPVAQDLRFVVAALRMGIDLERIGDEAASIAERVVALHEGLPPPVMDAVFSLMNTAKDAYKQAVDAFRALDGGRALAVCRSDEENMLEEVKALHSIMVHSCREEQTAVDSELYADLHGILICHSLNRICRRAANIAEQTYFIAEGIDIKHLPVST